jgi:YHS domain-containing protein
MRFVKMLTNIVPAICVGTLMVGIYAMGQTAKSVKNDSTKTTVAVKQLKPQTTCPVTGDPINKKLYVDYKGKRIYVCCNDCIAPLKKNPEKYIKKLESMGQSVETIAEMPTKKSGVSKPDSSATADAGYWTCPMHPEIHQSEPGKCPICGMNLEYKKGAKDEPNAKGTGMKGMKMDTSSSMNGMDHGKM